MELFAEIRREYQFGVGTIKGVARKLGVHRRVVRQALADAVPPERTYRPRATPALDRVRDLIDRILEADRTAPRKQRHTARRIHDRLQAERPAARDRGVDRAGVRAGVEAGRGAPSAGPSACRRRTPGARRPRSTGTKRSRSSATRRSRCRCSACAAWRVARRFTGPIRARRSKRFSKRTKARFTYFGGVFTTLRYDNLTSAVRKILRGYRREETIRFLAFRSHWQFDATFCTPGEGHEKGGVEGEAGYFRRNHWVPVPQAVDLDALNAQLLAGCRADEARVIHPRTHTVGEAVTIERASLRPLAAEPFDLQEISFPQVDGAGCVRVKTNPYSVPAAVGTAVEAKLGSAHVELWADGQCLARHERSYVRFAAGARARALPRCAGPQARARWPARRRWRNAARAGCGPPVTTRCGRTSCAGMGNRPARAR